MEKQQLILQAALGLFVANGFQGTPTSRVAQEAGVSNGTLFHYFPTKDELIVAVYNWVKDRLNEHLSGFQTGSVKERVQRIYNLSIKWALANPNEFHYIQQVHFSPQLSLIPTHVLQAQAQLHYSLLQTGVEQKVLKDLPVDLIYTLFSGQVFSIYQYLRSAKADDREVIISQTFDIVWDMLT